MLSFEDQNAFELFMIACGTLKQLLMKSEQLKGSQVASEGDRLCARHRPSQRLEVTTLLVTFGSWCGSTRVWYLVCDA